MTTRASEIHEIYEMQSGAHERLIAHAISRAAACPMPVFHVSPDLGWSRQSNGLGTTHKTGAPPRPTSVSAT
jgi:hypothetical protein